MTMAGSVAKVTLARSRDIPFNKLVLSQSNVRRVKAGVSVDELAEDIACRGLLQGLNVRAVMTAAGVETGMFEIPAGGRRYRALELLVKQKRLAKTAPVPCVVSEGGIAEEDSLAENVQRAPLHPLDQFRAFRKLREKGQSEEEIAAAFFVSVAVVRQRLRLAAVSPKLLDAFAEDSLTLDQIMAFTVSADHERQEQVFERAKQSRAMEPYAIRRMLTEGSVRATEKRAIFIGLDAYVQAGGTIMNDLFQGDGGGWLQDVALVERLVAEKLQQQADAIRAEGWKWIEVAVDLPYGHVYGLRRLRGEPAPLTAEEEATRAALRAEYDALEQTHADVDELPDGVDIRCAELETALAAFEDRPIQFDANEIAIAGAFVSLDGMGQLRIERGYVRSEDEPPIAVEPSPETKADEDRPQLAAARAETSDVLASNASEPEESEEDEDIKSIPDRLMTELTSYRTLALRHALGADPDVAFLAALHGLSLKAFYRYALDSCLELDLRNVALGAHIQGFGDSEIAGAFDRRHRQWANQLPKEPEKLWDALVGFDLDSRQSLFAHCVSLAVNAAFEPYNRRPRALAHADKLAQALELDMAATGWRPTVETYLGRVTKARILAAVREARGDDAARRLEGLKKGEMAETAENLIENSGWLPEPLRTPGRCAVTVHAAPESDADLNAEPTGNPVQDGERTGDEFDARGEEGEEDVEADTDAETGVDATPNAADPLSAAAE